VKKFACLAANLPIFVCARGRRSPQSPPGLGIPNRLGILDISSSLFQPQNEKKKKVGFAAIDAVSSSRSQVAEVLREKLISSNRNDGKGPRIRSLFALRKQDLPESTSRLVANQKSNVRRFTFSSIWRTSLESQRHESKFWARAKRVGLSSQDVLS
jgi:hypothetical protein